MKTTAVIWFSLFCFGINLQQGFGQCNDPIYLYRDADGDGLGDSNISSHDLMEVVLFYNEISDEDFNDNNYLGISNNIAYGCGSHAGWVQNKTDLDDSNSCITNISPQRFYRDADSDGFGNPSNSVFCSTAPAGYVTDNTDCDDGDASINPNNVWYQDADGDGKGGSISQQACVQPLGYVSSSGDACDNNSATLVVLTWYQDIDGDGVGGSISQQACVQPSGYVANNGDECDNDPNTTVMYTWFLDADKDTFGGSSFVRSCSDPSDSENTYVKNTLDRDDTNPCITDKTPVTYYEDADGDGHGNPAKTQLCSSPPVTNGHPWVVDNTDCDDGNKHAYPGRVWYIDSDGDGYTLFMGMKKRIGANANTASITVRCFQWRLP